MRRVPGNQHPYRDSSGASERLDCDYWAKVAHLRFHNTAAHSARISPDDSRVSLLRETVVFRRLPGHPVFGSPILAIEGFIELNR